MSKLSNTNYPLAFLLISGIFDNRYFRFCIFFLYMSILLCPQKRITILGDYSGEVHLFPFRTEKLSSPAQMVLGQKPGRVCRRRSEPRPQGGVLFFSAYV